LAISSLDYPVTPGDIYLLSYRESAGTFVSQRFQVDSGSVLDLGVFGKIIAVNMLFYELKQDVEDRISTNYTNSRPSLSIVSPGVFRVAVRDETSQVLYVTAWGLSRISEIVALARIPGASIRDIECISREGESTRIDLLKAGGSSPDGGDSLIYPGDTIVLHRAGRSVELRGEVWHPGLFELVDGEGMRDLVQTIGGGFTGKADLGRIKIVHSTDDGERVEYVSLAGGYESAPELNDGDVIVVGDKTAARALVWFEGAVSAPTRDERVSAVPGGERAEAGIQNEGNGRFFYYISSGVRLSDVLQDIMPCILPSADMGAVLLTLPGAAKPLVLDIRPLLSRSDLSTDIVLVPNARIFIPEYQSRISVAGAVIAPGFVPYLPGAPASYYVSLCGGFDPERNSGGAITVSDQFGHKRRKNQAIMPGDSIFAANNNPGYLLERRLPIFATLLSTAITALTFAVASGLISFSP
jgi:protein involved in polysaccharide export with SLBB domain